MKALKTIGFDQYAQAEQTGWVLYLEGSTDLAILLALAEKLDHPAAELLRRPFVHYVGNQLAKARDHFFGLREAKRDLVAVAILDRQPAPPAPGIGIVELQWRQNELENYLCFPETLLGFAAEIGDDPDTLFGADLRERQITAMRDAMDHVSAALKTIRKPDPFGPDVKASDDFLVPLFADYFERLALPNLMPKTDFHTLARFVPPEKLDPEISEKLDHIVAVARAARPRE